MRLHPRTSSPARTAVALSLLLASLVAAQSLPSGSSIDSAVASLPQCWQRCINTASQGAIHCNDGDNACVCRSYNSGFLTTVITCIKASCTDPLSLNVLVSPLELYCSSAGSPINPSAVSDAQHLISQTVSSMSASGTGASGMTTVTLTTTDGNGNQYLAAVPASIGQDTTIFGTPKTVTATSTGSTSSTGTSSSGATSAAGNGVITTTDAAGKTITTTASGPASSHSAAPSSRTSSSSRGYDAQATNGSPFDMKAQTQAAGAGVANHVAVGLLECCAAAVAGWLLL